MNQKTTILNASLDVVTKALLISLGVTLGCFFIRKLQDTNYMDEDVHYVKLADFPFGFTQVEKQKNQDIVSQYQLLTGLVQYYDIADQRKGKDGIVDIIRERTIFGIKHIYSRADSYQQFKQKFDRADAVVAQSRQRFNRYFIFE